MTIALTLAEFLTDTAVEQLPEQILTHAKMIVASTLASAAAGIAIPSAAAVRAIERRLPRD